MLPAYGWAGCGLRSNWGRKGGKHMSGLARALGRRLRLADRGCCSGRDGIKSDGKLIYHLTPLNAVQKRILSLMEVPLESYDGLVT